MVFSLNFSPILVSWCLYVIILCSTSTCSAAIISTKNDLNFKHFIPYVGNENDSRRTSQDEDFLLNYLSPLYERQQLAVKDFRSPLEYSVKKRFMTGMGVRNTEWGRRMFALQHLGIDPDAPAAVTASPITIDRARWTQFFERLAEQQAANSLSQQSGHAGGTPIAATADQTSADGGESSAAAVAAVAAHDESVKERLSKLTSIFEQLRRMQRPNYTPSAETLQQQPVPVAPEESNKRKNSVVDMDNNALGVTALARQSAATLAAMKNQLVAASGQISKKHVASENVSTNNNARAGQAPAEEVAQELWQNPFILIPTPSGFLRLARRQAI